MSSCITVMLLLLFLVTVTVTLTAYEQQAAVTTEAAQLIFSNEGFRSRSQALFVLARLQVRNDRMDAQISEMSRVDLVGFPLWVELRTFEMSRVDLGTYRPISKCDASLVSRNRYGFKTSLTQKKFCHSSCAMSRCA